jgi:hypothetical protein
MKKDLDTDKKETSESDNLHYDQWQAK